MNPILSNNEDLKVLEEIAKKGLFTENVYFLIDAQEIENLLLAQDTNSAIIKEKVENLIETYLKEGSENTINVDHHIRINFLKAASEIEGNEKFVSLLNTTRLEVITLLKNNIDTEGELPKENKKKAMNAIGAFTPNDTLTNKTTLISILKSKDQSDKDKKDKKDKVNKLIGNLNKRQLGDLVGAINPETLKNLERLATPKKYNRLQNPSFKGKEIKSKYSKKENYLSQTTRDFLTKHKAKSQEKEVLETEITSHTILTQLYDEDFRKHHKIEDLKSYADSNEVSFTLKGVQYHLKENDEKTKRIFSINAGSNNKKKQSLANMQESITSLARMFEAIEPAPKLTCPSTAPLGLKKFIIETIRTLGEEIQKMKSKLK